MTTPRFLQAVAADPSGLRMADDLPVALPYHMEPRDVLRLVEDLHELLHQINGQLVAKGYERLEELLDPAGFSGLVSRAVVDKVGRLSKQLVPNEYHNGYPDLLPKGIYARNRTQHGAAGGLEVKASRFHSAWQSHGPRGGWFLVVQFQLDDDEEKALHDREPTQVLTAMIAELANSDWNWQPAKEGRIRSGTASVKASGAAKLRSGAVWVEPTYEEKHQELLTRARKALLGEHRTDKLVAYLRQGGGSMPRMDLMQVAAIDVQIEPSDAQGHIMAAIKSLVAAGTVKVEGRGLSAVVSLT